MVARGVRPRRVRSLPRGWQLPLGSDRAAWSRLAPRPRRQHAL